MKWLRDNSVLVALGVLALLGAYFYFVDLKQPVREPGTNPNIEELAGIKAADVTRAEIKKGGPPIVLTKSGSDWSMESPVKSKGDSSAIDQILKDLLNHSSDFVLEDAKDLKQYRLDPAEFELVLTEKDGEKHTLQFGMQEPSKAAVYTRDAESKKVFLAANTSVDALRSKDQNFFRDKTLIGIPEDKMKSVTIQKPAGIIMLSKVEDNKWRLNQPWDAPADSFTAGGMATALSNLKGDRFLAADVKDLTKFGLATPQFTITAAGDAGASAGLRIGKKTTDKADYYASPVGSSNVLTITESTFQSLNKNAKELRSKRIVEFESVNVTKLAITAPKGAWEVEKSGDDWKMLKPTPGQKVNTQTVENLLMDLNTQAAAHVTEKAASLVEYSLDKPQMTVTVTFKDGAKQELFAGKKVGKTVNYYARGSLAPNAIFELGGYIFDNLNKEPDALK